MGLSVVVLLLLLGVPFLGVKWGFPDERVLPRSASARQVADMLDNDFANGLGTVVRRRSRRARGHPRRPGALRLRAVPGADVSASPPRPAPSWPEIGRGRPPLPTDLANGTAPHRGQYGAAYSQASNIQLDRLHQVAGPQGGRRR